MAHLGFKTTTKRFIIYALVLVSICYVQAENSVDYTVKEELSSPENYFDSSDNSINSSDSGEDKSPRQDGDKRTPFWNIAHMINSVEQIDQMLEAGANAIEVDVSFNSNGLPVETYHGFPCDCGRYCYHRENFTKFLNRIAELTISPEDTRLALVQFDLKLSKLNSKQKKAAGTVLATMIHQTLYARYLYTKKSLGDEESFRPPVKLIVSVNHASDRMLIESFDNYMRDNHLDIMIKHVGFDVSMNDNLNKITAMWNDMDDRITNIWQGDGLTNCANLIRGTRRLKQAIKIRDNQGPFKKVYYWTSDIMYHIRSILRIGADGTLTNQPQRVVKALNEPEFAIKYRLADIYDDPFA